MKARGMALFTVALMVSMGVGIVAGMAIDRPSFRPTETVTLMPVPAEGDPGWDCAAQGDRSCVPTDKAVTVTRYSGETHIVTGDGRLIIVPADPQACVRVAMPSADFAECVSDEWSDRP